MKLTIERADLNRALAATHRVVERRNTIPILSNILLKAGASQISLKATDLDIEVATAVPASIDAAGATTVPAHLLHDIARKLPEGAQISLDDSAGDGRMILRSGRSRFVLGTLPDSDFPDLSAGEMSHSFEIGGADLVRMIADTSFAISTDETRYYLNGIHLHAIDGEDGPELRAVATDGHRLARRAMPAPEAITRSSSPKGDSASSPIPGIIIPRKAVAEIERLVDKLAEPVRISLSASKLMIETGQTALVTKLIDGTFPDYQRVIPSGNARRATVDAAALLAAVDRVSAISSVRGGAVKLAFADSRLTLSVRNPDSGDASDEIEADYDAEPLEIGFNARYMADTLGVLIRGGADTVLMLMDTPGSPAIIRSRDASELLTVLMPMRV